jgi:hypothetical protein
MFALFLSGVLLVGLLGTLSIVSRRRDKAERRALGLDQPQRPDPDPILRAPDDRRCGFCDDEGLNPCRACGRLTCPEHRPWPVERFCYTCEAAWKEGGRRRAMLVVPLVIGVMVAVFMAIGAVALLTPVIPMKAAVAMFLLPLFAAAPAYAWIERAMRRRFRPPGLPTARVNRAS